MKRKLAAAALLACALAACSGLPDLTPEILAAAEQRWTTHKPDSYRLVVEMSGDRVEKGRFEVEVRSGTAVSLRRNGLVMRAGAGEDYTMEGLFRMLVLELGLREKPSMAGAMPGYSIYTSARFDEITGRLIQYRRIVGGTSNSVQVRVLNYEPGR